METWDILVGVIFATQAAVIVLKRKWGVALGCLSLLGTFALAIAVVAFWHLDSMVGQGAVYWVAVWVGRSAIVGVVVGVALGAGIRFLRKR
jgi:hypothetical protein